MCTLGSMDFPRRLSLIVPLTIALALVLATVTPVIVRASLAPGEAQSPAARSAVAAALEAMGGKERLQALRTLRMEWMGHDWHLEQSERPEGPWMTSYIQRTDIRDIATGHLRRETQTRNWSRPDWAVPAVLVTDGRVAARVAGERWVPASVRDTTEITEALALYPDRLLLLAEAAPDLAPAEPRALQGMKQGGVAFTWNGEKLTLFLNPFTHLPTMVEVIRPDTGGGWGPPVWGDVTERHWFGWWDLHKGVQFARQVTTEWNGFPKREFSALRIVVDAPVPAESVTIPGDTLAAIAQAASQPRPPAGAIDESRIVAVTPSVTMIPTGYNVAVVQQPDGLVVIEATTSSEFTARILGVIEKRFPGVPIKALVTTSDAWPHIGGVREYVARKIPIYALDLNVPILERLAAATSSKAPDALSRKPERPIWRPVSGRTAIGSGDTRLELVPVRGESGERMMIVAMPAMHLLYTSDLVQRSSKDAFFMPGMLLEVIRALKRENVAEPTTVFGMHLSPTPWTEIVAAATAAAEGGKRTIG